MGIEAATGDESESDELSDRFAILATGGTRICALFPGGVVVETFDVNLGAAAADSGAITSSESSESDVRGDVERTSRVGSLRERVRSGVGLEGVLRDDDSVDIGCR